MSNTGGGYTILNEDSSGASTYLGARPMHLPALD